MLKWFIPIAAGITLSAAAARADVLLHGQVIGTAGSYHGQGQTIANAVDGDLTTAFNAPSADHGWVGLDLGTPTQISRVGYAPWADECSRMIGGQFQASPTADFSTGVVTLYTVPARPSPGVMTIVPVAAPGPFRYVRYLGPAGGYCDIAEMAWYAAASNATPATAPMIASPAATGTTETATAPITASTHPLSTQPINPIQIMENPVPAGTAVHVNAWGLYPSMTQLFDHVLSWDFGQSVAVPDPLDYAHAATADLGHAFPGPQAAHVFAAPGQYPVTLTDRLRNADGSAGLVVQTLSVTVTVAAPGRTVFYVDATTGSETNPGTQAAPFASVAQLQRRLRSNTEGVLQGSSDPLHPTVYPFTQAFYLPYHNVVVSGVGSVQLHAISTNADRNLFSFDKNKSADITFNNVAFDSDWTPGQLDHQSGRFVPHDSGSAQLGNFRCRNFAFVDCTWLHLYRGVEITGDEHGFLMQGCQQQFGRNCFSQGVYDGGNDSVYAGDTWYDSVHESPVRFDNGGATGCNNLAFVLNHVARADAYKACFTDRFGVNHYVAQNLFVGAECSVNSPGGINTIRNLDLRQNVSVGVGTQDGCFDLRAGIFDSCVQDNRSWQPTVCYTIDPRGGLPPSLFTTDLLWRNNWGCAWLSPNPNSHARLIQLNVTPQNFQPDACDQFVNVPGPGPGVPPPATMPSH